MYCDDSKVTQHPVNDVVVSNIVIGLQPAIVSDSNGCNGITGSARQGIHLVLQTNADLGQFAQAKEYRIKTRIHNNVVCRL